MSLFDFTLKTGRFLFLISFFFMSLFSCTPKQEIVESNHPAGTPKVVGIYQNEKKTGEEKFYENGNKEMTGTYNENLEREGRWIYWYKNGNVWSECEYKKNLKHGKSTVYYENGKKRYEGSYRNDTTIGVWTFWNEKGEVVKEIKY